MVQINFTYKHVVAVIGHATLLGAVRDLLYLMMRMMLDDDMFNDRLHWFLIIVWLIPTMIKVIQHSFGISIGARANFFLLVLMLICTTVMTDKRARKRGGVITIDPQFTKSLDGAKWMLTFCHICDFF